MDFTRLVSNTYDHNYDNVVYIFILNYLNHIVHASVSIGISVHFKRH